MALRFLGAALTLDILALHRDWMFAASRDLEIQSLVMPPALEAELEGLIGRARDAASDR